MASATASFPGPAPRPRRSRLRLVGVLAVVVLAWHGWLVQALLPGVPAGMASRVGAVQVRLMVVPTSVPTPSPPPLPLPLRAAPAGAAAPPPLLGRPAAPDERLVATLRPDAVMAQPDTPPVALRDTPPAADVPAPAPAPASDPAAGLPPPLYPAQPPAPAVLRYALRYNGQAGEARLQWQHDGQQYQLALDGRTASGALLVAQTSDGALDANGLAPVRFVDRRRHGRQQAANFRRDIGRIGFSGPAVDYPAWPGAQDRLSWLAQFAAILAADATATKVQLFVADARGGAALWQLQRQADEAGATPWGERPLQRWQRDPPQPEGLQVQLWLAPGPSPGVAHWPVRLRYTALRSGDVFELQLMAPLQLPP